VRAIFDRAKGADRLLDESEVLAICRKHGVKLPKAAAGAEARVPA